MKNKIYEVFAQGLKLGICVAPNAQDALQKFQTATTRRTSSKIDESCDHRNLEVREFVEHVRGITEPEHPAQAA